MDAERREDDQAPDAPFDLETAPLDDPYWYNDWGGDGSDLSHPVRAHVLAALLPTTDPYPPPLDALLLLGDPSRPSTIAERAGVPITQEHIPDLVRMVRDRVLNTADGESMQVWAPVHAIELLTTLDTTAVLPDLLPLFDLSADWFERPLKDLFVRGGAVGFEMLGGYLLDPTRWGYGRSAAADALAELAAQQPELRDPVVAALREVLRNAEQNHESTNGLIIADLVDLDADEALPEIRHAFASGCVDEMINGGWGDVLGRLGIEPDPDDPLVDESQRRWDERREQFFPSELRQKFQQLFGDLSSDTSSGPAAQRHPTEGAFAALAEHLPAPPAPGPAPRPAAPAAQPIASPAARQPSAAEQAKKAKSKRKMAQASRKANQGKKKR